MHSSIALHIYTGALLLQSVLQLIFVLYNSIMLLHNPLNPSQKLMKNETIIILTSYLPRILVPPVMYSD